MAEGVATLREEVRMLRRMVVSTQAEISDLRTQIDLLRWLLQRLESNAVRKERVNG